MGEPSGFEGWLDSAMGDTTAGANAEEEEEEEEEEEHTGDKVEEEEEEEEGGLVALSVVTANGGKRFRLKHVAPAHLEVRFLREIVCDVLRVGSGRAQRVILLQSGRQLHDEDGTILAARVDPALDVCAYLEPESARRAGPGLDARIGEGLGAGLGEGLALGLDLDQGEPCRVLHVNRTKAGHVELRGQNDSTSFWSALIAEVGVATCDFDPYLNKLLVPDCAKAVADRAAAYAKSQRYHVFRFDEWRDELGSDVESDDDMDDDVDDDVDDDADADADVDDDDMDSESDDMEDDTDEEGDEAVARVPSLGSKKWIPLAAGALLPLAAGMACQWLLD